METYSTQPRVFVMPVVREIPRPWMAEPPLTQRELVAASLIARPERPRAR